MGVISLISLILCIMLQIIKIWESSVQFLWDSKIRQHKYLLNVYWGAWNLAGGKRFILVKCIPLCANKPIYRVSTIRTRASLCAHVKYLHCDNQHSESCSAKYQWRDGALARGRAVLIWARPWGRAAEHKKRSFLMSRPCAFARKMRCALLNVPRGFLWIISTQEMSRARHEKRRRVST
jgi:hypothetical protein